jgi:uncharacterized membrane protein YeaQ/YmgE (transglycosylase-associated protein family)
MNFIIWIFFGVISGLISSWADPDEKRGISGAVMLGILGSLLGGFLASFLLGVQVIGFNMTSFVVAVLGSLMLLFAGHILRRI